MRVDWVDVDGERGLCEVLKLEIVVDCLLLFYLDLPGCVCWGKQQFLLDQLLDVLLLRLLLPRGWAFAQLQLDVEALAFGLFLLLVVRQLVGFGGAVEVGADFVLDIAGLALPGRSDPVAEGRFFSVSGIHELFLLELALALVGHFLLLALELVEQGLQAGTQVHKIYIANSCSIIAQ